MSNEALRPYLNAIGAGDQEQLAAAFAENVQLKSPLVSAAVDGKAAATKVLGMLFRAADSVELGDVFVGPDGYTIALTITAGDTRLEGLEYVHLDQDGLVDVLMVTLRPLEGLVALQNRLAGLIGQTPLALVPKTD
jgi:arginine decarboxylase-like protein